MRLAGKRRQRRVTVQLSSLGSSEWQKKVLVVRRRRWGLRRHESGRELRPTPYPRRLAQLDLLREEEEEEPDSERAARRRALQGRLQPGGPGRSLPAADSTAPPFAELDHALLKTVNVLDLSLSMGALQDLLLAEVLRVERREILKHRHALQLGVLQLEGKLEATEKELVDLISQPQRSLLEEENFMPMVRLLQTQIQALKATHQHMVSQYQHQAALCDKYRQVARLGVALYLALQQVARLHPLYRFTSDACISYTRQALMATKRTADTSKQEALPTRLLELGKAVLRHLLSKVLPYLREKDRLLFCFLGALATVQGEGGVRPVEWLAFCGGLQAPSAKALLQAPASVPCCRPSWVSARAWEECGLLENLPGFQGLLASLAEQDVQWQEYFRLPSTVVGPALCPSHAHLSPFQRAILWRMVRPGAMSRVIEDFTTCLLGWSMTEEAANINAYAYSRANKPIIFLMPPAGAPGSFTHPLHWIQQMAAQRGRVGRVVVISFGTPDAAKRVWRSLPLCTRKGKWLVLNNCHLQARWDPEVLVQLNLVLSSQAGVSDGGVLEIHPKFRLWLITTADAPHSVPGTQAKYLSFYAYAKKNFAQVQKQLVFASVEHTSNASSTTTAGTTPK